VNDPDSIVRLPRKCPICGKPTVEATKPFCSKRCADIDLSRWLKGVYAIPVEESNAAVDPESADDDTRDSER
jgi:endogenous inhibitor of DNA gyrase (YacG/DUF329 family)